MCVGKGSGPASGTEGGCTGPPLDDGQLPFVSAPLKTLDIFAGCGGLSWGLKQAGIADPRWAVECVEPAAKAYSLNEPQCTVFNEDCNVLLKHAMDNEHEPVYKGKKMPKKGEVRQDSFLKSLFFKHSKKSKKDKC